MWFTYYLVTHKKGVSWLNKSKNVKLSVNIWIFHYGFDFVEHAVCVQAY